MTITYNDGGTGGDLKFFDSGKIDFWDLTSNLTINGQSYVLVADIKTLAKQIAANSSGFYAFSQDYDAAADGVYGKPPIATIFSGTFEGLAHQIENLTINTYRNGEVGLFQQTGATGVLRDIRLQNATLSNLNSPRHKFIFGLLVGNNFGAIAHAPVDGAIECSDDSNAGGLIGDNFGLLIGSTAAVRVIGGQAGGLAGWNAGIS